MLRFAKYQSLENDFVIFDRRASGGEPFAPPLVRHLCDRHDGIGADGVVSLWPDADHAGRVTVQNADGSDSQMCVNGLRCVARFLFDTEPALAEAAQVTLVMGKRVIHCVPKISRRRIRVDIGEARFIYEGLWDEDKPVTVSVDGRRFAGTGVAVGNPHLVILCDGEDPLALAERYGAALSDHEQFPCRVNVSFVRPRPDAFDAVVYERGVGLSKACGSAAAAVGAAVVRQHRAEVDVPVQVCLPGGTLFVTVSEDWLVTIEGEVQRVFAGEIELE